MYSVVQLRNKLDYLRSARQTQQSSWQVVFRLVRPSRQSFSSGSNSSSNSLSSTQRQSSAYQTSIYDNFGATASQTLTSYLHSSLTNPHSKWMILTQGLVEQVEGLNKPSARQDMKHRIDQGFQFLTDQLHLEWQSSNFHQEIFSFYRDLVDIGTACLHVSEITSGDMKELSFKTKSMYDVYFVEDSYGRPNHVFCIYSWSARQVVQRFASDKTSEQIKELFGEKIFAQYKSWSDEVVSFAHCVFPDYTMKGMKYKSYYFLWAPGMNASEERQKMHDKAMARHRRRHGDMLDGMSAEDEIERKEAFFLEEETLDYLPYIVTRIRKDSSSFYGAGYSVEALPLLLQLQEIQRSITIAAQKNIEPPLNVPSSRVGIKFSSEPNAQNPLETTSGGAVGVSPSIPLIDLNGIAGVQAGIKEDVNRTYLIDKIIIEPTRRNRTATEVHKRTGEEIKLLSPFLGALENEFLSPLADITLGILRSRKKNKTLQGTLKLIENVPFGHKYVSDIARSQTAEESTKILEMFQYLKLLSEANPAAIERIDWIKTADKLVDFLNIPRDILKTPREFVEKMQEMNKAAEAQKNMDNMGNVKDASEAAKNLQESQQIYSERQPKEEEQPTEEAFNG